MRRVLLLLLLGAAASTAGCSRSQPHVVLVTFDTTRWDHVGYASGREGLTPHLDAIAARGTWFSSAVTVQPLTLPAHTSILTGLYPYRHGVRNNGTYVVPPETVTLAGRLREAGYATHAIVSAFVLDSQFGLDKGFDGYDDDLRGGPKQKKFMFKEIKAEQTADKAIAWLRGPRPEDRPFFLWLHFFDPHAEYEPPEDIAMRFAGDPYSGEIHYADRELGRVIASLDELRLLDQTLFIFTADHGDGLGEHGERTHGIFIYESTTRVPLLMAGPQVPAGKRVDSVVSVVDIVPTVLDLLGQPGARELDGRSLRSLWKGASEQRTAYVETLMPYLSFGWAELRALRGDGLKVIEAPRPEVYRLDTDPSETRNLHGSPEAPPQAERLRSELASIVQADPFTGGGQQEAELDDETRAKLTALGYVWSAPARGPDAPQRPDPKDRIGFWERFQAAQGLVRRGSHAEAARAIGELLASDPENVIAMGSLAGALVGIREPEKALEVYRRMIALDPKRDAAYLGASQILREKGEYAQAEELARVVIELRPLSPDGYVALGDVFLEQERFAEAEVWFRKAVEVDPHSMLVAAGLGNCLKRAGRLKESLEVLRDAYRRDTTSVAVTYNLALVTELLGDHNAALALYRAAIELEPDHAMSWNNLGSLLDRIGNRREALRMIAKAYELDETNAEAVYNLGALLLAEGHAQQALPRLEEALRLRPGFQQAAQQRALALQRLGRLEDALTAWRQVAGRMPLAWLQVARLELAQGREAAAREALRIGLAKSGDGFREAAAKDPKMLGLLEGL
jgi:choline-sulfatase